MDERALEVNGRCYGRSERPVVVVCIDGSEPAYHEEAVCAGRMPYLASVLETGTDLRADSAIPSFTNPNNLAIATGAPPAVNGICGNFFYDRAAGEEVMMNDPSFLRAPTIFAAFSRAGARVAVITAKDKLRRLLGHGVEGGVCFSSEKAAEAKLDENGIEDVPEMVGMPQPSVYSTGLSELVLAAGVKVLERERPEITYLSLTDYLQHKAAPGTDEANDFYAMMDGYFARLDSLGAVLVLVADHGMNAKTDKPGKPNVVYLQDRLDGWFGEGAARVILPITDPYVGHHGALGSYATVHLPVDADRTATIDGIAGLPGIELVLAREEACERFELPPDRVGDVVVLSGRDVCIGASPDRHDLSKLNGPLRSHGGLWEQKVPFIVNRKLAPLPEGHRLKNYDAFWVGTNFVPGEEPVAATGRQDAFRRERGLV